MSSATINKIKLLPVSKQQEVADFVEFLVGKYLTTDRDSSSVEKQRIQMMGRYKGKIQMSDDFNETPDDFQKYL
ncbi:MAG TPA: DUF2281 domain-containing protein [Pelobium sp.]